MSLRDEIISLGNVLQQLEDRTAMTNDKTRADFEKWASENEIDTTRYGDGYDFNKAQLAWGAWEAATQAARSQSEPYQVELGGDGVFAGVKVWIDPTLPPDTIEMRGATNVRCNIKTGEIYRAAPPVQQPEPKRMLYCCKGCGGMYQEVISSCDCGTGCAPFTYDLWEASPAQEQP